MKIGSLRGSWCAGAIAVFCASAGVQSAGASITSAALADLHDASNPAMVPIQPPQWLSREDSAIEPPDEVSDQQQDACTLKILGYVNDKFHTTFTFENVALVELPNWKQAERGFIRGGGYNIRIVGYQTLPVDPVTGLKSDLVKSGRYMHWTGYLELGVHPSLHIPGSMDGSQSYTRVDAGGVGASEPNSTEYFLDFVAHIDSADPYEPPAGSLFHLFRDVIGASGRNPCPGSE